METTNIFSESGIIITLFLILIPVLIATGILISKVYSVTNKIGKRKELDNFNSYLKDLDSTEVSKLEIRKKELDYQLSNTELAGESPAADKKGLINNVNEIEGFRFIEQKRKSKPRPYVEPELTRMILWYIGCATFWLVFGTTIGEYLGIKFVAPDIDHQSWLSFGRLRPVHTNAVFWGWASLAMIGLGYYVVPRVSNTPLHSIKTGYFSLILINASVIIGSICLMAGINNSGGEYREYVWPVMLLFGIAVIISLVNYVKTIAKKTTKEIYVSNWYIVAAMMYVIFISVVADWPTWEKWLGGTIV